MIHPMLKEIIDMDRSYDPWGAAMNAGFIMCDVLTVEREGALIPADLHYRPAAGLRDREDVTRDSFGAEDIFDALDEGSMTHEDVSYALGVLDRYLDVLKRAGRDH